MHSMRCSRFSMLLASSALLTLVLGGAWKMHAEAVKDREGAVRQDKAAMEQDPRWIYNDVERGFAEAGRTGKPLLVVLRCIPCLACMGLDASVLAEDDLQPLLDKFVCVRLINANSIDLAKFQFDYDLSFSTLFFHADGTLYGRFGSWTHQKDPHEGNTTAYRRALEAVLGLHAGYPANKDSLKGKQGVPVPFKTPLEIPLLAGRYQRDLDWQGKVVQSCVHCHQVGDAFRATYRDKKEPMPLRWIYPMPAPETIGLTLAPEHIATVAAVAEGSPAALAGLKPGDELVQADGQPLISVADVAWALHHSPDEGALSVALKRNGQPVEAIITLAKGWRSQSDISRRVATWPMRGMAFGGLVLEDLPDAERTAMNLGKEALALRVKGVGQYGKHATAKKAGFMKDDVVVAMAGVTSRMTEGGMLGHLLQRCFPGESVTVEVMRAGQKVTLQLPMQ